MQGADAAPWVQVLSILYEETLPQICSNAMAGFVEFTSKDDVFEKEYGSCDMFIDVLTDRGFSVSYMRRIAPVPVRIDAATGEVHTRRFVTHVFRIQFPGGTVRDVRNIQTQQSSKYAAPTLASTCDSGHAWLSMAAGALTAPLSPGWQTRGPGAPAPERRPQEL